MSPTAKIALLCAAAVIAACTSDGGEGPNRNAGAGALGGSGSGGGGTEQPGTGGSGDQVGSGGQGDKGGKGGKGGSGGAPPVPPVKRDAAVEEDSSLPKSVLDRLLEVGCAKSTMRSELLPSNMLFVIDRSASMECNPPPTTDSAACELDPVRAFPFSSSKWEITRTALLAAIEALPDDTVVGLSYFSNDDACGVHSLPTVPLAPLNAQQRSAVTSSLKNVEPDGATPLVGATILAYRHLHELASEGEIRGKKFVVLLTDGEQSAPCSDPKHCSDAASCTKLLIDEEVPKAAAPEVGIRTFVIGAPGSEPARKVLSQIAKNGGTALTGCDVEAGTCHFDMTVRTEFQTALADALSQITGRALSCELPVPKADDIDPERVNVVYSPGDGSAPQLIVQDDRGGCDEGANGWQYTADATKIRLCGTVCEQVRADHGARVDVVFGCMVRGPE